MKKVFMVLGGIFFVVILGIAGMGSYAWYKSSQYEETAVPYIKATVPVISNWDTEVIKGYMVPEVLAETTDGDFAKIIKYLSKLGSLKKMEEPSFARIYTGATINDGKNTYVTYNINAEYEKGAAVINIVLLDLGDHFQIYRFHINSMALVE